MRLFLSAKFLMGLDLYDYMCIEVEKEEQMVKTKRE